MRFNRQRLIFGLYLIVLIAVAELLLDYLKLPGWPAFVALVLFFIEHMDVRKVPNILVGAAVGIAFIILAPYGIGLLAHLLGAQWGQLTYILLVIYAIVAFGEMLPLLFNNHAFMFLTVAALALEGPKPAPWLWMAMAVIGGGILIGGVLLIIRIMRGRHASVQ
ncbi:MAG TPA: DUF1097 family protein [Acidisoma sp.]|jgi:hypothetical protein|nr:DUF1097 family protein [Acidisoma sp.]